MSLTKVFKSNHHDFAFPSHTLVFPMCPLWESLLQESTKPAAAGVAECEAEQCPMSVGLHGKHTCNYSQGLVICNLGFFLDLWYFGIQDIIYLCTRNLWSTCLACNLSKMQFGIRKELFLYCSVILLFPLCWWPSALPASNSITYPTLNENKKRHSTLKIKLFFYWDGNFKRPKFMHILWAKSSLSM